MISAPGTNTGTNIGDLSDADLVHLAGASAAAAGSPPAADQPTKGPVAVDKMSDADLAALMHGSGATPAMPTGEAAGRLFYKHLTFGTQPGADRAKAEQASA